MTEGNPYIGKLTQEDCANAFNDEWATKNPTEAAQIKAAALNAQEGSADLLAWQAHRDAKFAEGLVGVKAAMDEYSKIRGDKDIRVAITAEDSLHGKARILLGRLNGEVLVSEDVEYNVLVKELERLRDNPMQPEKISYDVYQQLNNWKADLLGNEHKAIRQIGGDINLIISVLVENDMIEYTPSRKIPTPAIAKETETEPERLAIES